jgi:hypothetical protein
MSLSDLKQAARPGDSIAIHYAAGETARPKPRGDERRSLRIVLDDQGLHGCFDSGMGASSRDPNLTSWPAIRYTAWRRSQFAGRR